MDGYEATRIVFSRIQSIDPENASKIMGLLLIQDHGEKEMIRLAFGPEAFVHSIILKAKKDLGLLPPSPTTTTNTNNNIINNNNSPSAPSSPSPFSTNTRLITTKIPPPLTIPNPSSSSSSEDGPPSTGKMNSSALPYYSSVGGVGDVLDELQFQEQQLCFLNESNKINSNHEFFYPSSGSPNSESPPLLFPPPSYWSSTHRRSCSVSDVMGGSAGSIDDINSGLGWRPCMYFARGYCKNGSTCRFIHGADSEQLVGSPNKIETCLDQAHELIRSKSAVQQRLAVAAAAAAVAAGGAGGAGGGSQLLSNSSAFPYSPKSMNLFLQQNDSPRSALLLNDDLHKFNRSRLERSDFSGLVNPASRQIYLTFPADSTFREEDVSNYFSIYGPVQDVRIPYQQKRMFGFVTFVYPETVKIILAKGNPHFVCDARVLVKPYKEKGKVPDKYRKQPSPVERGDFSPCGTPTGLDSRDPFDLPLGSRMFYNSTQDMLWRRKMEEQADLQQALELQSRRLMGLQLLDVKKNHHHRALSTGSPIPSPNSPNLFHHSLNLGLHHPFHDISKDTIPNISVSANHFARKEENSSSNSEDDDLLDNLEHNLPDSPFASPTKGTTTTITTTTIEDATTSSSNNNLVMIPPPNTASSPLDMTASFKSFNCQRFSSGGINMYSGTGGPTCPVGI